MRLIGLHKERHVLQEIFTKHISSPSFALIKMRITITSAFLLLATALLQVAAIPSYGSLAGLSEREIREFVRTAEVPLVGAQPAPGPLADDSSKLVADAAHPYQPAGPNDIRGPCPGLNTLASHGVSMSYLSSPIILTCSFLVPSP